MIPVRFAFATGVVILVLVRQMPMTVIPLAAIDVAGAIWTGVALRAR